MAQEQAPPSGPDLTQGVALADLADGKLLGHVGDDAVLLVRRGNEVFAIGAKCTHYHGPLAEGLVVGDTVRCPWHHACFSLRTGEALRAPALSPVACWTVEQRDGKVFVTGKARRRQPRSRVAPAADAPQKIVIVGGGAAGFAAAEMLRREGFEGSIVMLSDDAAPPVDRPNLSKDYLAGNAPEEWVPLRAGRLLRRTTTSTCGSTTERRRRSTRATREVMLADGSKRRLRPAAARDRRRAGAAAAAGRGPAARAYAAHARRQPRHHRAGGNGAPRGRDRRELHRARGGGGAARARHRGARRGAGAAADGARAGPADRRLRARPARRARRDLPPGGHGDGDRRAARRR